METRDVLRFVGVVAALVAAVLHLAWGAPRLVVYLGSGQLPDPRPLLFVLSALAVGAAALALYWGAPERPLFGFLVAVMAAYFLGYVAWHLAGHPIMGPGGVTTHHHPDGPVATVLSHLANSGFAQVTIFFEVVAVAALAPLLWRGE